MNRFSLFENDPLYRLLSRLGLVRNGQLRVVPSVVFFVLLTWVPTVLLGSFQGVALGPTPRTTFLFDFAAYAQFFVAIPLFIIAEVMMDDEFSTAIDYLKYSGILRLRDKAVLEAKLAFASRLAGSVMAQIICYVLGVALTWAWLIGELNNGVETWHAFLSSSGEHLSWAGAWDGFVGVPIFCYWLLRWIWKLAIWYWILRQASKSRLMLAIGHPDRFGGLGFLAQLQSRFAILILAVGIVFASVISYKLIIEQAGVTVLSVWAPVASYILFAPLIFIVPLFFFSKQMYLSKRRVVLHYSALLTNSINKVEGELNLENASKIKENTSYLSDLRSYFEKALEMHIVPFDFGIARQLVVSAIGPMLLLILPTIIEVTWRVMASLFI